MRRKSIWAAVIFPAVVLTVLGIAAWFFIARPAVRFDGDRITGTDPASFYLRFDVLNTEDAESLFLREEDTLRVSWLIESGSVDILIGMKGEAPLYQANGRGNGDAADFDLIVPQTGDYTVAVTGRNARGWIRFSETQ